jgi:hypothetical protein
VVEETGRHASTNAIRAGLEAGTFPGADQLATALIETLLQRLQAFAKANPSIAIKRP